MPVPYNLPPSRAARALQATRVPPGTSAQATCTIQAEVWEDQATRESVDRS